MSVFSVSNEQPTVVLRASYKEIAPLKRPQDERPDLAAMVPLRDATGLFRPTLDTQASQFPEPQIDSTKNSSNKNHTNVVKQVVDDKANSNGVGRRERKRCLTTTEQPTGAANYQQRI